jgi:hypothetical protein
MRRQVSGENGGKLNQNSISSFPPESNFLCVTVVLKYLNCYTFSNDLFAVFMSSF